MGYQISPLPVFGLKHRPLASWRSINGAAIKGPLNAAILARTVQEVMNSTLPMYDSTHNTPQCDDLLTQHIVMCKIILAGKYISNFMISTPPVSIRL